MESIKAYSIPTTAPKDLIEEYFKLRKTVLGEILKHVKYFKSGKAHLKFDKNKRKELLGLPRTGTSLLVMCPNADIMTTSAEPLSVISYR